MTRKNSCLAALAYDAPAAMPQRIRAAPRPLFSGLDHIKETLTSRNWPDALAVQARWVDETIRDYNTEITNLTKLYTKAAASAARKESQTA